MNRKMVFRIVGLNILFEAALMLLPLLVSIIYQELCSVHFLITIAIAFVLGAILFFGIKPNKKPIFAKEGLVIVALSWIFLSAIGALPFYLSKEIPSYVDAFFETVSGFTTTGASILNNVENMSRGLLFWRSFTHWIGGMGVLVFIMAIIPSMCDRSIHIMRAEVPGPIVGKLVPKVKDTAKILYLIYISLTVLQIILLLFGGMSLFDSVVYTFGTAGTGGFGIRADSVASYNTYCQIVITVFMLIFGTNFNLYYLILIKNFKTALKSGELWCYLSIFAASSALIAVNVSSMYSTAGETIKHSAFQVASIMTTTGYVTTDFDLWPVFSKTVIFILMFIGAMASSTGGGLKVSRIMILFKAIRRELKRVLHPRSVSTVQFEGKLLDNATISGTLNYFALYIAAFIFILLIICINGFDFETNLSSVASCINNVGPAFSLAGPTSSYAAFSPLSKIALSFAMLLGRLELYPMLFILVPSTWSRKK